MEYNQLITLLGELHRQAVATKRQVIDLVDGLEAVQSEVMRAEESRLRAILNEPTSPSQPS